MGGAIGGLQIAPPLLSASSLSSGDRFPAARNKRIAGFEKFQQEHESASGRHPARFNSPLDSLIAS
jgi:hypothetical protein